MTQTYSDVTIARTDPSHSVRQMDRQTNRQMEGRTDRQTDRRTETNRQRDRRTDRQTDIQMYKLRPITLSETDGQTDAQTDRSGPSHSLRRAVTPTQQGQHTIALL